MFRYQVIRQNVRYSLRKSWVCSKPKTQCLYKTNHIFRKGSIKCPKVLAPYWGLRLIRYLGCCQWQHQGGHGGIFLKQNVLPPPSLPPSPPLTLSKLQYLYVCMCLHWPFIINAWGAGLEQMARHQGKRYDPPPRARLVKNGSKAHHKFPHSESNGKCWMKCDFEICHCKKHALHAGKRTQIYDFEMKNYMTPPPSGGNNERSLNVSYFVHFTLQFHTTQNNSHKA